jgi:hypothetical protein
MSGFEGGSRLYQYKRQNTLNPSSSWEVTMWLTLPRLVGVVSPLPILLACASSGANGANVITAPELSRSRAANAYDAIRRVRPDMLRNRNSGGLLFFSPRSPLVAVDDSIAGGIDVLRSMPIGEVGRIEYVSAWKTARRYGSELRDGILLVAKRAVAESELSQRPR